jgi:hypothetical protein
MDFTTINTKKLKLNLFKNNSDFKWTQFEEKTSNKAKVLKIKNTKINIFKMYEKYSIEAIVLCEQCLQKKSWICIKKNLNNAFEKIMKCIIKKNVKNKKNSKKSTMTIESKSTLKKLHIIMKTAYSHYFLIFFKNIIINCQIWLNIKKNKLS